MVLGEDDDGQQMVVDMQLIDTAGDDDDTRGPAHYPSADVFLVCFSIISPSSFESISNRVLVLLLLTSFNMI